MKSQRKKGKNRKYISLLLQVCLLASLLGTGTAVAAAEERAGKGEVQHWASELMTHWVEAGWLQGYEDGSLRPDEEVTRAEWFTLVNRRFALEAAEPVQYSDLPKEDWAYGAAATAVKAGYAGGYEDGTIRAHQQVSRAEAAVMLGRLLQLPFRAEAALQFAEGESLAEWSRGAIGAVSERGIFRGYEDGSFRPERTLTRAEAVVALTRAAEARTAEYSAAGTYGPATGAKQEVAGDVIVKTAGVTLQRMVILGNLLLAEGIGEGEVTLEQVEVRGRTDIRGGGANSVYLIDASLGEVTVDKANGQLRIVVQGSTQAERVEMRSGGKLELQGEQEWTSVVLGEDLPEGATIVLSGHFGSVEVKARGVKLEIEQGEIGKLQVSGQAEGVELTLGKEAKVAELGLEASVTVKGEGEIVNATMSEQAKNTTFAKPPQQSEGAGAPAKPVVIPTGGGGGAPPAQQRTATPVVNETIYAGSIEISGTAEPGAQVRLWYNGVKVSEATALAGSGAFTLDIGPAVQWLAGETAQVTAVVPGKQESQPFTATVREAPPSSVEMTGNRKLAVKLGLPLGSRDTLATYVVFADNVQFVPVESVVWASDTEAEIILKYPPQLTEYAVLVTNGSHMRQLNFVGEAEQLRLEFPLEKLYIRGTAEQPAYSTKINVLNQYGEDFTEKYYALIDIIPGKFDVSADGTVTIMPTYSYAPDEIASINAMLLTSPGAVASTNLKVAYEQPMHAASLGLLSTPMAGGGEASAGGPGLPAVPVNPNQPKYMFNYHGLYHPQNKELNVDADPTEFYILFTMEDGEGNELTAEQIEFDRNLMVIPSLLSVGLSLDEVIGTKMLEGKTFLTFQLKLPSPGSKLKAGKQHFIFISMLAGTITSVELQVYDYPQIVETVFADSLRVVAGQTLDIPYEAYDQYDRPLTVTEKVYQRLERVVHQQSLYRTSRGELEAYFEDGVMRLRLHAPETNDGTVQYAVIHGPGGVAVVRILPDEQHHGGIELGEQPRLAQFLWIPPLLPIMGEVTSIPYEAKDQFGAPFQDVDQLNKALYFIDDQLHYEFRQNGTEVQLVVQAPHREIRPEPEIKLALVTALGELNMLPIHLYEAAKPVMIKNVPAQLNAPVAVGGTVSVFNSNVVVFDQYGRERRLDFFPRYRLELFNGYSNKVSVHSYAESSQLMGEEAGSANIKLRVFEQRGIQEIYEAGLGVPITVVSPAQIDRYEVSVIGNVYATHQSGYAKQIKVVGYTETGEKVDIPFAHSLYYSATVTENTYLEVRGYQIYASSGIDLDGQSSKTFTVTVNTYGKNGASILEGPFVVSSEAPRVNGFATRISLNYMSLAHPVTGVITPNNLYVTISKLDEYSTVGMLLDGMFPAFDQYGVSMNQDAQIHIENPDITTTTLVKDISLPGVLNLLIIIPGKDSVPYTIRMLP